MMMSSERKVGRVKFFNSQKGYGFIIPKDMDTFEVFVHHTAIKSYDAAFRSLAEGEEVEFDLIQGPKGFYSQNVTGPNGVPVRGDPRVTRPYPNSAPRGYPSYGNVPRKYAQGFPPNNFSNYSPPNQGNAFPYAPPTQQPYMGNMGNMGNGAPAQSYQPVPYNNGSAMMNGGANGGFGYSNAYNSNYNPAPQQFGQDTYNRESTHTHVGV